MVELESFRTLRTNRRERLDRLSVERGVRQLLADKISGNLVGLWLLAPEHLRLGTWDLLTHWAGPSPSDLSARTAMQLVHEAALGVVHTRTARTLSQKGYELLNGLPFVISDSSVHDLLMAHTVLFSFLKKPYALKEVIFPLSTQNERIHHGSRTYAGDPQA